MNDVLNVQKYLKENGLQKLQDEFKIAVSDYTDSVVLNYNQIDSPRFHPIVDECRALILEKDTWKVIARSFDRFYNVGEGVQQGKETPLTSQRIASLSEYETVNYSLSNAIIEEKVDGSILSLYYFDGKWQVSTRKMGHAEGQTNLGRTFSEIFFETLKNTNVLETINNINSKWKDCTFVFELIGPENRVVTPYEKNDVILIGIRDSNGDEFKALQLDYIARIFKVNRPKYFKANSYEELINLVKSFPAMNEGVVLKIENKKGSHFRLKVKNPAYLAISHLRGNGSISPKRVLNLIMENNHLEYLSYFECDRKYFDFVEKEYAIIKNRIETVYNDNRTIENQKEFALSIIPKVKYSFESGIIFSLKKSKGEETIDSLLTKIGSEKISKSIDLKQKFIDNFKIKIEDE